MIRISGILIISFPVLFFLSAVNARPPPASPADLYTGSHVTFGNVLISAGKTRLSLDPGTVTSEHQVFYFLRLDDRTDKDILHIYPGDLLAIVMNDITVKLYAVNVLPEKQHVVAYYYINQLDLFDLGNAKTARVVVFGGDESVQADFSTGNIAFIQEFATKNIIEKPEEVPEPVRQLWGFFSAGTGEASNFWLAYYLKPFKNTDTRDFLAFGAGFRKFEYHFIYYWDQPIDADDIKSDPVFILHGMYGLSFPVNLFIPFRLDCGVLIENYHLNTEAYYQ